MGFLFAPRDVCDVLFLGQRSSTRTGPTWFTGQNADVRNNHTSILHPSAYKPRAAGKPYRDPRTLLLLWWWLSFGDFLVAHAFGGEKLCGILSSG